MNKFNSIRNRIMEINLSMSFKREEDQMKPKLLIISLLFFSFIGVFWSRVFAWPNYAQTCSNCHAASGVTTTASVDTIDMVAGNTSDNFGVTVIGSGYHDGYTASDLNLPSGWSADVDFANSSGQWFWTDNIEDPDHSETFTGNITVPGETPDGDYTVVVWGAGCNNLPSLASDVDTIVVRVGATGVDEEGGFESCAGGFILFHNYPNPFNSSTVIPYKIPSLPANGSQSPAFVPFSTTLKVYNIRGQLVRTLVDQMKMPGEYRVIWDARDEKGNEVGSGVYFYKLEVENYQKTRMMIFIK